MGTGLIQSSALESPTGHPERLEVWLKQAKAEWKGPDLKTVFVEGEVFDVRLTSQPLAWSAPFYPPFSEEYGFQCKIGLGPEFWWQDGFTNTNRYVLIAHEYGHCLGLNHPEVYEGPSVMSTSAFHVTELDRANMRRVSPWLHRVVVEASNGAE